jgi:Domain of unknown function (DUF1843)
MPTRKSSKSSKKSGPIRVLYGPPIYEAIERGDINEMKALAKEARKQVAEVRKALASLDKKIGKA